MTRGYLTRNSKRVRSNAKFKKGDVMAIVIPAGIPFPIQAGSVMMLGKQVFTVKVSTK